MIHRITANKSSFHTVEFAPGLNVVLADRTETSTQKDTRNGLGKSTLIDIIDFCLGSNVRKGQGLSIEPLQDWEFTLEITLEGNRVKATRAIESPNWLYIEGPTAGWVEQPDSFDLLRGGRFKLDRWRALLGWAIFGLHSSYATRRKPSFRSLISYFIRRGTAAYIDPFSHTRHQPTWDRQLHIALLLGMNWENASKWQELKDQEKGIKAINDAIKSGAMEGARGSVGELEAECVQLESQLKRESNALEGFKVHPQYETIQNEADRITETIHNLTNENIVDQRRLSQYKESVEAETPPSNTAIDNIYEESGVIFPDLVRRTLTEAKEFHSKIIENRRAFLETEIRRIERKIRLQNEEIRRLTDERADLLRILETHGALQELAKLQERIIEIRSNLEQKLTWLEEIKDRTSLKRNINIAKAELTKIAEQDHQERRDIWSVPLRLFNDNSQALYEAPGRLVIDIDDTGFKYDVEIDKSGSEGIEKMKIFCFDLMLLQIMSKQNNKLNFLIHDSGLYDGVDSRQRALALEHASKVSSINNAQYICTLNSDMVPREDFSEGFDFDEHVRLTLTDEHPSKRLLGFDFERPPK